MFFTVNIPPPPNSFLFIQIIDLEYMVFKFELLCDIPLSLTMRISTNVRSFKNYMIDYALLIISM